MKNNSLKNLSLTKSRISSLQEITLLKGGLGITTNSATCYDTTVKYCKTKDER